MRSLAIDKSLEGIAGQPLAMLTVPGSVTVSSPLGPLEGRILYVVMNIISLSNAWSSPGTLGTSATVGALQVQTGDVGVNYITARVFMKNGSTNLKPFTDYGLRIPGNRVVAWVSVSNGMNTTSGGINDATGTPINSTPGDGMEVNPTLYLNTRTDVSGIFSVAYRGEHKFSTRARIINYLALRYGIAL